MSIHLATLLTRHPLLGILRTDLVKIYMKRKLLVLCMITFLLNFVGCSNLGLTQTEKQTNEVNSFTDSKRIYVMETNEDAVIIPTIQLNEEDNTFSFTHDPLSSVIIGGTYEIKDGILSAKSDNGNDYLFEVVDEDTLRFIQDGSAKIELKDDKIGIPVSDRAEFKLKK